MAVEKRRSPRSSTGWVYRVRYVDPHTGERLSRTFDSPDDAEVYEAQRKVSRRQGTLQLLDAGQELLGDYALDWLKAWSREPGKGSAHKSKKTVRETNRILNRYILELEEKGRPEQRWGRDAVGWLQVRQVNARAVERFKHRLEDLGVGVESQRRALYILQMVMQRAVKFGDYPLGANPVPFVKKPPASETRQVEVFTPGPVEQVRARFLAAGDALSAYLVSTLAYAGLRPGEALALQVKHLKMVTTTDDDGNEEVTWRLKVEQRNSLGEVLKGAKSTKRAKRSVLLPAALVEDLNAWLELVPRGASDPLFPDSATGTFWNEWKYRNWRRREYGPAARGVGLKVDQDNPYDLRHVYVSLRLAAGHSLIEVAEAAGHAPSVCSDVYAGVIAEYEGKGPIDWEAEIAKARKRHGS